MNRVLLRLNGCRMVLWSGVLAASLVWVPNRDRAAVSGDPFEENPSPFAEPRIYPQAASTDKFSAKESQQFEKAWSDFSRGKSKPAQKKWTSLLKKHPRSASLLTALSYVDFSLQHPDQAVTKLETALEVDPRYIPALKTLGRYFMWQKNYDRAYRYVSSLAALRPDDPEVQSDWGGLRLLLTDRWIADARAARAQGNWPQAESAYLLASAAGPELGAVARELGEVYAYQGKWKEAEKSYLKAIGLDASDTETKKKLVELYRKTSQREKAEILLREMARENAEDEEVRAMLSEILAHTDPTEEALNHVRAHAQVSRGDFGGMLAVRFPFLKEFLKSSPEILTDLNSHWARKYLPLIAGLDLIPALPNHQFRPNAIIRRYEVAVALDRLMTRLNRRPPVDTAAVKISDVPYSNQHRPAIERIVASGVMPLKSQYAFRPQDGISGMEAFKILEAVENLLR